MDSVIKMKKNEEGCCQKQAIWQRKNKYLSKSDWAAWEHSFSAEKKEKKMKNTEKYTESAPNPSSLP